MMLEARGVGRRTPWLIVAAFVLVGMFRLNAVPRMFGDESWYAMPTVSMLREGTVRLVALDGRGGVERAYVQPKLVPNLFALPFVAVGGVSLTSFRLATLVCAALGLLGLRMLALDRFSPRVAHVAMLLLCGNFWFYSAAHCFRPEVFELTAMVWFYYLFGLALRRDRAPVVLAAGVVAALAALSHQVAMVLTAALALTLLFSEEGPWRRRLWVGAKVVAVSLVALAPYGAFVLMASRLPEVSVLTQFTGEGRGMPLTLATVVGKELLRWKNYFHAPLGFSSVLVALYVWGRAMAGDSRAGRQLAWALALCFATCALCVPLATGRYAVIVAPFLALAVAHEVVSIEAGLRARGRSRAVRTLAAGGLALAFVGPSLAVTSATAWSHRSGSYQQLIDQLRDVTGEAPVAGPIAFWLGYSDRSFTVTNIPPDFVSRPPTEAPWLDARMQRGHPRYLLETTTPLQATDGLSARPTVFPETALAAVIRRQGRLVATVASRDFGPVRVWRLDPAP